MHSSAGVVLRSNFAHGCFSQMRSNYSRNCQHFTGKSSPCATQCRLRPTHSNNRVGLRGGKHSVTNVRPTDVNCLHTRTGGPRRRSSCLHVRTQDWHRPAGIGIGQHKTRSWSNSAHPTISETPDFQQRKNFSSTDLSRQTLKLEGTIDRFNGVRINIEEQLRREEKSAFTSDHKWNLKDSLLQTLAYYKAENKPAVWLEISAHCGHVIPVAAEVGFSFHHAEKNNVMMYQWLDEGESRIPEYATHQVGVSGFVLDQQRQRVLMVQDRHRIARWKFPGGYSKLGEDFSETAKREVFEETGIKAEFKSILAFRQQHQMPYSFNRSDIYVVCRLEPVTFDLTVCSTELLDAKWIPLDELLTCEEHTKLTVHVAGLAKQGLEKGFQDIDVTMTELPSVYKGMTYKLFSRPLS